MGQLCKIFNIFLFSDGVISDQILKLFYYFLLPFFVRLIPKSLKLINSFEEFFCESVVFGGIGLSSDILLFLRNLAKVPRYKYFLIT